MSKTDNNTQTSAQRKTLRHKLLENGYFPLPAAKKGVYIKGWTRQEITDEFLDKYARSGSMLNTGLRCDNLVAFDIDVLDKDLADAVDDLVCDETALSFVNEIFCRVGRWPKRLLLYRLAPIDGPIRSRRTGKYKTADGLEVMLEVLTGAGRQFIADGIHPGTGKPYEWEGAGPADVPWHGLPEITYDKAVEVMELVERELFADLEQVSPGGSCGVESATADILTDITEVALVDGGEIVTFADIREMLADNSKAEIWGNILRENGVFGDSGAVHFMLSKGDKQPVAYDFARDVLLRPTGVISEADSALLAELLPPKRESPVFDGPLCEMLADWVQVGGGMVHRLDDPGLCYSMADFRLHQNHLRLPPVGKGRPVQVTTAWLGHPERLRADAIALRPDKPDVLLIRPEKGAHVLNTYRPPELIADGGSVDVFLAFMTHLVPKDVERELVLDWLALKFVEPWQRLHGLVMVTPTFGTGRGTLTAILQRLFGYQYIRKETLDHVLGEGSQAVYNEYLSESLIVVLAEAAEVNVSDSPWRAKMVAYEKLKLLIDPGEDLASIKRKYGRGGPERLWCSFFIQTNHLDAYVLPPDDRRLIVVDNTRVSLIDAALLDVIHDWKNVAPNIGALGAWLRARHAAGLAYNPFGKPLDTVAKRRMVEASESDIDKAYNAMMLVAPGDIITPKQWLQYAAHIQMSQDLSFPGGGGGSRVALGSHIRRMGCRISDLANGQIKVDGSPVRPWIIRNFDRWETGANRDKIRAEIAKNKALIDGSNKLVAMVPKLPPSDGEK